MRYLNFNSLTNELFPAMFAVMFAVLLLVLSAVAFPALANSASETKTLGGCEIFDKGGYWNKVDATCEFSFADDGQEDRDLADLDNDASTPPTRVGH